MKSLLEDNDDIFMENEDKSIFQQSTMNNQRFIPTWINLNCRGEDVMIVYSVCSPNFETYIRNGEFTKDLETLTSKIENAS